MLLQDLTKIMSLHPNRAAEAQENSQALLSQVQ